MGSRLGALPWLSASTKNPRQQALGVKLRSVSLGTSSTGAEGSVYYFA